MASLSTSGESPEKQLIVCCARTRIQPEVLAVRAILGGIIDWSFLLAEAEAHSTTPLLERNILETAPDLVSAEQTGRLKAAVRANAARCLLLTAELVRIDATFRSQNVRAIPYKGPVVAAQAYGNVALRAFDDIDMILPQRDMRAAHDVILGLGYQAQFPEEFTPAARSAPIPGEYKYYNHARDAIAELHTEHTLRHFPVRPNLDDFVKRLVPLSLSGHEIETFAPGDTLPLLCIHGSKDLWGRISWIADVSEMIQATPRLDWDQVLSCSRSLHAERMLNLGLLLAAHVMGARLPNHILSRAEKDSTAVADEVKIRRGIFSREGYGVMSARDRFLYRRRMVQGTLAGWRYATRLAVAAAEEDWQTTPLPRALSPLYFALRPIRLLQKYGWLGRRN